MFWDLYVLLSYFSSHPFSLGGITGRQIEELWSVWWYYRLLLLLLLVFGWFCVVFILLWGKDIFLTLEWGGEDFDLWSLLSALLHLNLYHNACIGDTVCGDKLWRGWDTCLWRGSLATREPEDLCVLWAKPYAKWKPEAVSCGPSPGLRSLGLQSLMVISVRQERL